MKRSATTTISRTGRKVSKTRYWAGAIRNWKAKRREADKKGRQEQESRAPCYQFVIKIYFFYFLESGTVFLYSQVSQIIIKFEAQELALLLAVR